MATLATRQEGVVSRKQLRVLGLGEDSIDDAIAAGRLHPRHSGVYAVGHRRVSRTGRFLAAVLSAGDDAVLSHRSAASLWELRAPKEGGIDVIAMTHRRGDREVQIHQHQLEPDEIETCQGVPVTTPLRTLIDLASCVSQPQLEAAIRQAVYRNLTTTALLVDAVDRHAGRRGMRKLRKALINLGEAPGRIRSPLEERFLPFLRKHKLPMPELNGLLQLGDFKIEPDCMWQDRRLIVEVDGRDAHDSTPAFEADRARDAALTAAGWRVIRVTSWRLRYDGTALARELRTLLTPRTSHPPANSRAM